MTDIEFDDRVAELLVAYGMVTEATLARAREVQRGRETSLPRALLDLRLVASDRLASILEEVTGVRAVDPTLMTISPEFVEQMVSLIPGEILAGLQVFPAQAEINALKVCLLNPTDRWKLSALEAISGCHVEAMVSNEVALQAALEQHFGDHLPQSRARMSEEEQRAVVERQYRGRLEEPFGELLDPAMSLINRNRDALARGVEALEGLIRDPRIIRLVHQMLCRVIDLEASDIHVEPLDHALRVRARVDGAMRTLWTLQPSATQPVVARLKVMASMSPGPATQPLDGRISYDLIWGRDVDFRFSLVPAEMGERIVLRALDRARKRRSLRDLGFRPDVLERVERSASLPNGILLVTGPTGSGKTTTLYALLDGLNDEDTCVLTVEDPVESRLEGAGQVHCDESQGVTFASVLRSFLRQDPDIIMVGEIRDAETADTALKAALTGHLVLSTLHTNDAPGAIVRLVNMDLEPFVIASALRLVLAQRLVRRLCQACRRPVEDVDGVMRRLGPAAQLMEGHDLFAPGGCPDCMQTGYHGRIGIHEALIVDGAIEELILARGSAAAVRKAARAGGMRTLRESALALVAEGVTSVDEAIENTTAEEA